MKSDNLRNAHPKSESISETGTTNFEKPDFLSVLNRQTKELKAAFLKIVHADYSIIENVYYLDEHSTDYADEFIADYKNGLVLPDHDVNKRIILSKK